jgi:hypothetical protein
MKTDICSRIGSRLEKAVGVLSDYMNGTLQVNYGSRFAATPAELRFLRKREALKALHSLQKGLYTVENLLDDLIFYKKEFMDTHNGMTRKDLDEDVKVLYETKDPRTIAMDELFGGEQQVDEVAYQPPADEEKDNEKK